MVQGVQVERATVRTTWTPWAASARLCLGRWWTGWEQPAHATTGPRSATTPPPSRCRPIPRRRRSSVTAGRIVRCSPHSLRPYPSVGARRRSAGGAGRRQERSREARPGGAERSRGLSWPFRVCHRSADAAVGQSRWCVPPSGAVAVSRRCQSSREIHRSSRNSRRATALLAPRSQQTISAEFFPTPAVRISAVLATSCSRPLSRLARGLCLGIKYPVVLVLATHTRRINWVSAMQVVSNEPLAHSRPLPLTLPVSA